jgi:hypothetical protein
VVDIVLANLLSVDGRCWAEYLGRNVGALARLLVVDQHLLNVVLRKVPLQVLHHLQQP